MAVIWPLHGSLRTITLSTSHHAIQRQPHNLCKQLADLVFRELDFGGELQDCKKGFWIFCVEEFRCEF